MENIPKREQLGVTERLILAGQRIGYILLHPSQVGRLPLGYHEYVDTGIGQVGDYQQPPK